MEKFIGFFRNVTIALFTGALIWSYAFLASQVNYRFDPAGDALGTASKDTYFFGAIVIFLIINVVCFWFVKTLKKISTTDDGTGIKNRSLKQDIINWVKGFAGVLNLFLSLVLVFLGLMNMSADYNIKTMGFYVYLGPVLILVWFFYLAAILGKRRN
ncbi:hypothetical protein [Roseivirga sp.]|uniref:hypothetical protein n=1 Tax=Roseivirga sp. TaxID=1964215 RepID=UPI003B8BBB90